MFRFRLRQQAFAERLREEEGRAGVDGNSFIKTVRLQIQNITALFHRDPGVIEQAVLGNIDYMVGVAMMVGSIPGAIVGANLVKRVPERALRFAFALFLLLMAVLLVVNEASVI